MQVNRFKCHQLASANTNFERKQTLLKGIVLDSDPQLWKLEVKIAKKIRLSYLGSAKMGDFYFG